MSIIRKYTEDHFPTHWSGEALWVSMIRMSSIISDILHIIHYPVVGVNWLKANDYCLWRSDRVNEQLLIDEGELNPDPESDKPEQLQY